LILSNLQAIQSVAEGLWYEDGEDDEEPAQTPAAGQTVTLQGLRSALLDADLRKLGSGCLPDDVNRSHSSSIKGPMVLQVGPLLLCEQWCCPGAQEQLAAAAIVPHDEAQHTDRLLVHLPAADTASFYNSTCNCSIAASLGQCSKCQPDQSPFSLTSCRLLLLLLLCR
jgi:hypothetical protein